MFNDIIPETQTIFATVVMGIGLITIISAIGYATTDFIRNAMGLLNE